MSANGINPGLRQINQFKDGAELSRQLSQHEDFVREALGNVAQQAAPKLRPTQTKTAAYTAALDDLVVAAGTFSVTLPVAKPQNAGREVGVLVKSGTVTVTVVSGLVQGAATDALATVGLRRYVSDGVGWWRAP